MGFFQRIFNRRQELPAKPIDSERRVEAARALQVIRYRTDYTPDRVQAIQNGARQGNIAPLIDMFDHTLTTDANHRNVYEQRALAVSGSPYSIVPGGNTTADARAAALLAESISDVPRFSQSLNHWATSVGYGFAASNIRWAYNERRRRIVPAEFLHVHPNMFKYDPRSQELLLTTVDHPTGERLDPGSWIVVLNRGTRQLPELGLLNTTAILSLLKMWVIPNWAAFVRDFGLPYVWALVEQNTDQVTRRELQEAMQAFGSDKRMIADKSIDIKMLETQRETSMQGQFIEFIDMQNSKAVYGSTLVNSSGEGSSSYALGSLHGRVRQEVILADCAVIEGDFRTYVSLPFCAFNGLTNVAPPRLKINPVQELGHVQQMLQLADLAVNRLGLPVSQQQIRVLTGFAQPATDDDRLPGATKPREPDQELAEQEPEQEPAEQEEEVTENE